MHDTGNIPNKHSIADLSEEEIQKEIERLISDRDAFNAFVYTPLNEALGHIQQRKNNTELDINIKSVCRNIPPVLCEEKFNAVLARPVATPNFETRRFFHIIDALEEFKPIIWEYTASKFTPNMNELKRALAKMSFFFGEGKKGGLKFNSVNILDFNLNSGKKISEVTTSKDVSLVDFHHDYFKKVFGENISKIFFDASEWYENEGGRALEYYEMFLCLFIQNSILFENFVLEDKEELRFVTEIFLPSFIKIKNKFGIKPLIVALSPTNIEGDKFWSSYPGQEIDFIS